MFRIITVTQPARAGWLVGTFSTVTHGALIAFAVVSTGKTISSVREDRATAEEHITYIEPAKLAEALRRAKMAAAKRAVAPPAMPAAPPDFSAALSTMTEKIHVPDITAAPDLTAVTDSWLSQPDGLSEPTTSLVSLLLASATFVRPANGIYTAEMVDRSVEPHRGNPTPRYPLALADMRVEGDFIVRFIVDTTGKVQDDKIEFPNSMHRLFAESVRNALRKSRYLPARFAGRVVSQQVIQEFKFTMGRR